MSQWKKIPGIILGALLAGGILAGCGTGGGGGSIAYLNFDSKDAFGGILIREAFSRGAQSQGIDVTYYDAKGDSNLQIDQLKEAVNSGAKTIVLNAVDGASIAGKVEEIIDEGTFVITLNRDVPSDKALAVMSDNLEAGKLQGEYMARSLPQGARVVYLEGTATQSSAQKRWEGFKTYCLDKRPDIKLLGMQDADYSKAEAMKTMALWLTLFPKIDGVICGNDQMALGAVAALKAANRLTGCQVSGVDATEDALKAVAAGEMVQTVKQDAVGQAEGAVALVAAINRGEKPASGMIIPFVSITKENLSQFMK